MNVDEPSTFKIQTKISENSRNPHLVSFEPTFSHPDSRLTTQKDPDENSYNPKGFNDKLKTLKTTLTNIRSSLNQCATAASKKGNQDNSNVHDSINAASQIIELNKKDFETADFTDRAWQESTN